MLPNDGHYLLFFKLGLGGFQQSIFTRMISRADRFKIRLGFHLIKKFYRNSKKG